jgi:biopolymer transport protein ExbB/TolQ
MTRPIVFLLRMVLFLIAVAVVCVLLGNTLFGAFAANPLLNGLISFVALLGIGWNLRQVIRLSPEVAWLDQFQRTKGRPGAVPPPRLLTPMARMLETRQQERDGKSSFTLSSQATRALLDTIGSRLDESRELSRYMIGLLIFLGLLGTFWGLLLTISAISDVIAGMSVGSGDINALFEQLKSGLSKPLRGMSTAFSASMLGLSGSLVLGFLDLTAGQAQNRFYNELEEWLAGLTRLSSGVLGGDADGGGSVPVYVQALLEQTAENMEGLQRTLARGEDDRRDGTQALMALNERLGALAETMRTSQQLMLRLAETQASIAPALQKLGERSGDDVSRAHLRNIELILQRLITETEQGRTQSTTDLRNEIKILTRTIAAIAESEPR